MKYVFRMVAVLVFFGLPSVNYAQESVRLGPHGGSLISRPDGLYEVTIDPQKQLIDLYALKSPTKKLPRDIKVKLGDLQSGEGKREVHLKAVDPWRGLPHFQGSLILPIPSHVGVGSQKGFELEFDF